MKNVSNYSSVLAFTVGDAHQHHVFMRKLRDENGWSRAFAEQAFSEYKRFMVLTSLRCGRMVPSITVDKVWHFHLTYTRSYWQEFCPLLGGDIHHEPSGESPENARQDQQDFQQTLALYEQVFGHAAPASVWLVNQSRKTRQRWLPWVGVTLFSSLGLVACSSEFEQGDASFYFKAAFAAMVVIVVLRWLSGGGGKGNGKDSGSCAAGCGSGGCGS